jgi:hypothetical protein
MSNLNYKIEPAYCGDCVCFVNEDNGEGICNRYEEVTWHGEIACEDFVRKEDDGDE